MRKATFRELAQQAAADIIGAAPDLFDPYAPAYDAQFGWPEDAPAARPTNGIAVAPPVGWRPGDPQPEAAAPPAPALAIVPRRSLREYVSDVEAIADTVESLDSDELTEPEKAELSQMLISAISGTKKKVDATASALAIFEARSDAAKAECARLDKRVKFYDRQTDRLQAYVLRVLDEAKLERIDGETSTLQKRLNPASVVIEAGAKFTHEFMRYPDAPPPEPDKTAIKKALQAKRFVPGASLARKVKLVRS